jgi:hypothetical protein
MVKMLKVKAKFALEQAMMAHRGISGITLLFVYPRH